MSSKIVCVEICALCPTTTPSIKRTGKRPITSEFFSQALQSGTIKTELPLSGSAIANKFFQTKAARSASSRQLKTLYWTRHANATPAAQQPPTFTGKLKCIPPTPVLYYAHKVNETPRPKEIFENRIAKGADAYKFTGKLILRNTRRIGKLSLKGVDKYVLLGTVVHRRRHAQGNRRIHRRSNNRSYRLLAPQIIFGNNRFGGDVYSLAVDLPRQTFSLERR